MIPLATDGSYLRYHFGVFFRLPAYLGHGFFELNLCLRAISSLRSHQFVLPSCTRVGRSPRCGKSSVPNWSWSGVEFNVHVFLLGKSYGCILHQERATSEARSIHTRHRRYWSLTHHCTPPASSLRAPLPCCVSESICTPHDRSSPQDCYCADALHFLWLRLDLMFCCCCCRSRLSF